MNDIFLTTRRSGQMRLTVLAAAITVLIGTTPAAADEPQPVTFDWIQTGALVEDAGISGGLAWSDYDRDGDVDLFIANWRKQPNLLYRNDNGALARVENTPVTTDRTWSSGGAWGDYDGDGDLDLFVANQRNQHNQLYRNDGAAGMVRVEVTTEVAPGMVSLNDCWPELNIVSSSNCPVDPKITAALKVGGQPAYQNVLVELRKVEA